MDNAGAAIACPKGSYTSTLVETAVSQGKCQEEDKSWWSQKIFEREQRWGLECMKAAHREHFFMSMVKSLAAQLAAKDSEMAFVDDCWRELHDMTHVDGKKQLDEHNAIIIEQRDAIIADQAATIADRDASLAAKDKKIAYQASALRSPEAHVVESMGCDDADGAQGRRANRPNVFFNGHIQAHDQQPTTILVGK
ncbi:MAG: hypothetical protein Q9210_003958 [Variospora velana]